MLLASLHHVLKVVELAMGGGEGGRKGGREGGREGLDGLGGRSYINS